MKIIIVVVITVIITIIYAVLSFPAVL